MNSCKKYSISKFIKENKEIISYTFKLPVCKQEW